METLALDTAERRTALLALLPPALVAYIPRNNSPAIDLANIVSACLSWQPDPSSQAIHPLAQLLLNGLSLAIGQSAATSALNQALVALPTFIRVNLPADPRPYCPYRSLFAFQEEDAPYFFGREIFTTELVTAAKARALVAVIGPSGSGKSSAVFAGLIPLLRRDPTWLLATPDTYAFRPGTDPFAALAGTLIPLLEPTMSQTDRLVEQSKLAQILQERKCTLLEVVNRILPQHPPARRLLLVADQFEEIFTGSSPAIRKSFLDCLLEVIKGLPSGSADPPPLTVVLTLRADFFSQALAYRPLADALQTAQLNLGPMSDEELARAITKPAAVQGLTLEEGLTVRLLAAVGNAPGRLPLLEFTLTQLWERRVGVLLTQETYAAIGGVEEALAQHADAVYAELPAATQMAAHKVFLQLVQPGADAIDTRRVAHMSELDAAGQDVVPRLADARLVVTGRDPLQGSETVEVVHEALISHWGKLKAWVDVDRAFRLWQEGLRSDMRKWQMTSEDEGALLRGALLATAEDWLTRRRSDLSTNEQAYIERSIARREATHEQEVAQVQAFAAQQEQVARTEHRRATEQAQANHQLRRVLVGLAVITLVAIGAAGTAWLANEAAAQARSAALAARDVATSRQLAAQALAALPDRVDLALLLAVEATAITDTLEARSSLLTSLTSSPHLTRYLRGHTSRVNGLAFAPTDRLLATADDNGQVRLWDLTTGRARGPPLEDGPGFDNALTFSPDGTHLAVARADGTLLLRQLTPNPPPPIILSSDQAALLAVAFSPNGILLAAAGQAAPAATPVIQLWTAADGLPTCTLTGQHHNTVTSLAFSPDGQFLASGSWDGTVVIWQVAGCRARRTLGPIGQEISSVAFAPTDTLLAAGSYDHTVHLWDITSGAAVGASLIGPTGAVRAISFRPDGSQLAAASADQHIYLWDMAHRLSPPALLTGHSGPVTGVGFSPDGYTLASTSDDHQVILWTVDPSGPLETVLRGHTDAVQAVAFDPTTPQRLASAGWDQKVILWDTATGQARLTLRDVPADLYGLAFSPDGAELAAAANDEAIHFWSSATGEPRPPLPAPGYSSSTISWQNTQHGPLLVAASDTQMQLWHLLNQQSAHSSLSGPTALITTVALSADGHWLAAGSEDRAVWLWQEADGAARPPLEGHHAALTSLAFQPGGSLLVSADALGDVRLWDVAGGVEVPPALTGAGRVVAVSPDGRWLATGMVGGAVQLWDLGAHRALGPPLGSHDGQVTALAFSPDGRWLASASKDTTVRLWDVAQASWIQRACGEAGRTLTLSEWQQYLPAENAYHPSCAAVP